MTKEIHMSGLDFDLMIVYVQDIHEILENALKEEKPFHMLTNYDPKNNHVYFDAYEPDAEHKVLTIDDIANGIVNLGHGGMRLSAYPNIVSHLKKISDILWSETRERKSLSLKVEFQEETGEACISFD